MKTTKAKEKSRVLRVKLKVDYSSYRKKILIRFIIGERNFYYKKMHESKKNPYSMHEVLGNQ